MDDEVLNTEITNSNGQKDQLFAIFDGHGGTVISSFCKIAFPRVLEYNIKNLKNSIHENDLIETAL